MICVIDQHLDFCLKWFHALPSQVHETAASFAAAYSLGKQESAAAVNLMRWVPADIKEGLTVLVRPMDCLRIKHGFFDDR